MGDYYNSSTFTYLLVPNTYSLPLKENGEMRYAALWNECYPLDLKHVSTILHEL